MSVMHKFLTFIGLEPEDSHDMQYEAAYAGSMASSVNSAQTHRQNGYRTNNFEKNTGYSNAGYAADAGDAYAAHSNISPTATQIEGARGVDHINTEPKIIFPENFDESAKLIGDYFRTSHPVIINFENSNQGLARRVLDFASGICYGRYSKIRKVANRVYIMTPANFQMPESDIRTYIQEAQKAA